MTIEKATEMIRALAQKNEGLLNDSVKFQFKEDVIFLDDTQRPVIVNNEDNKSNCTINISLQNFEKLIEGTLNPMTAVMVGKIKIKGDMGVAMKLTKILS